MKTNVLMILTAAFGMGNSLPATATINYPFVAPNCSIAIVQPDNASGYYMSEDCKQVYVLPPAEGTVNIVAAEPSSNMDQCTDYDYAIKEKARINVMLSSLRDRLVSKGLNPAQIEEIKNQIQFLKEERITMFDDLKDVPTTTIQVVYRRPNVNSWIGNYLQFNPNLGAEKGIRFFPAPIAESYVSFTAKQSDGDSHPVSPVLSANIKGLHAVNSKTGEFEMDVVKMNGSMSGQIVLGLAGACQYRNKPVSESVAAYLVSNITYTVPVMSWAGYVATLNSDTAIRNLVHSWQNRTHFSVSEASDFVSTGTAGTAFSFEVTDFLESSPFDEEARANFFAERMAAAQERLTNRLLEQMATAGFLEMNEKIDKATAPEPGYIDEVMSGRSCSKSFFGLRNRCSSYTYTVRVPQGSSADSLIEKVNETNFTNTETVTLREIFYRVHTGTFVPEKI